MHCGADSIAAVKRFLDIQSTFDKYEEVYKRMERRILSDNFDAWYYRLPFEERHKGYKIFERHWGKDKVILGLLYDIENKQFDINQKRNSIEDKDNELESKNNELANKSREFEELKRICAELTKELADKNMLLERYEKEIEKLQLEISQVKEEKDYVQEEYQHTLHSMSYKVGRIVMWIPRMIARVIRKYI